MFVRRLAARYASSSSHAANGVNSEAISVKVPWGEIQGLKYHRLQETEKKESGNNSSGPGFDKSLPMVCLHGLSDNLGSYERLIPLLQKQHPDLELLVFDFPGHGKSSHRRDPNLIRSLDFTTDLARVVEAFDLQNFNCLAHSYGGIVAEGYNVLFPGRIKNLIRMNCEGLNACGHGLFKKLLSSAIVSTIKYNPHGKSESAFTYQELMDKHLQGLSFNGIRLEPTISEEAYHSILQRGIEKVKIDPHGNNDLYRTTRDPILSNVNICDFPIAYGTEMIEKLYQRSKHNELHLVSDDDVWYNLFLALDPDHYYGIKNWYSLFHQNENYQCRLVEGNHHVHMNEPGKIADIISSWISDTSSKTGAMNAEELALARTPDDFLEDLDDEE